MAQRDTRMQRVAREDVVLFINACFACTHQREFYSDAQGQAVSIDFLHRYILGNYRRLYARTLAAGINHFNKAKIIARLLETGRDTPEAFRHEENALIRATLKRLPPQRVFRMFTALRRQRVNNRRSRAVIRDYLKSRRDPAFDALKYRNKINAAAAHAHLDLPGELGDFLFAWSRKGRFETPLFESFRKAHYSQKAVYELPYTVAEGLAAKHGIARDTFLARIEPRLTKQERLRLQRTANMKAGVDIEVDLDRVALTKLALFILSLDAEERRQREREFEAALKASAHRALGKAPAQLGKVAAVLDRSGSSAGSREKRRRPLAVALAASALLRQASSEYRGFWTADCERELFVTPFGQTNLAGPVLDALDWGAELIVIVSDGFENDPPGAVSQLVDAFHRDLDPQRKVSVIHANPVFDAENHVPRGLGPGIPTVGLRDAEDLPTMLGFARFVDGAAPLAELEGYLGGRVGALLAESEEEGAP
jgi:hypothetical protein